MAGFKFNDVSMDTYFDKVFYINLKKDTERDRHMVTQFQKCGIKNYERVEAVELAALPGPGAYRNFIRTGERYILGQLSCKASHLLCIGKAKDRGYKKIMVFEDDAVFLQNPGRLLLENYHTLGAWDMLYFGGLVETFYRGQIVCTHAYGLSSVLFDDILNMAGPSGMEIDNFYAKVIQHMSYNNNKSGKYDIKMISPFNAIIQGNQFKSNIQGGGPM